MTFSLLEKFRKTSMEVDLLIDKPTYMTDKPIRLEQRQCQTLHDHLMFFSPRYKELFNRQASLKADRAELSHRTKLEMDQAKTLGQALAVTAKSCWPIIKLECSRLSGRALLKIYHMASPNLLQP